MKINSHTIQLTIDIIFEKSYDHFQYQKVYYQLQTVDLSANALRGQIVAESTSVNLKLVCNYH